MPDNYSISLSFLTSLAVGLLIGLERERHKDAKAGVRTFALIAMLGTICAMLGEKTGSPWILVAGLAASTYGVLSAYQIDSRSAPDAGTTTVMAAALTFCLGAAVWYGYSGIVIAVAIVVTGLLHY
ncbi:MAG TPA: MgtC/SapB family protein, partial [Usitatibacteraceae bacterium]|nr:MgtC/SapB family protein [Usitatibacteraceae bacterium]